MKIKKIDRSIHHSIKKEIMIKNEKESSILNAQLGQPFLQAEVLGLFLSSPNYPPINVHTVPYSIVSLPEKRRNGNNIKNIGNIGNVANYSLCETCDAMIEFVRAWEKKIHPFNVLPDVNYHIATSTGGSSLCAAAFIYSVTKILSKPKVKVTSYTPPPFFGFYKSLCNEYLRGVEWVDWSIGRDGQYIRPLDIDIQVVISPNNPTGDIATNPSFTSPFVLVDTVYDHYLFTGKMESVNPWLWRMLNFPKHSHPGLGMVTSFSKFGPGGFRAGYLWTNTFPLLRNSFTYISNFYYGSPTYDYAFLENNFMNIDPHYFTSIYSILQRRQMEIRKYIPSSLILNVNSVAPYLLVKISPLTLLSWGIRVQNGQVFLVSDDYSRINLMLTEKEWTRLVQILKSKKEKL